MMRYTMPGQRTTKHKSAALAGARMKRHGVPAEQIEKCSRQILATKDHRSVADQDTDLLTDADLAILGRSGRYTKTTVSK